MGWTQIGTLGGGLPSGGALNDTLIKMGPTDGNATWGPITTNMISGLKAVAITGSYGDLDDLPALGTIASKNITEIIPNPWQAGLTLQSTGPGGYNWAPSASAPVTKVAGRIGDVTLSVNDISGLGSAAAKNIEFFATAAQGTLASSAVQPAALTAKLTVAGNGASCRFLGRYPVASQPGTTIPETGEPVLDGDWWNVY